MQQLRSIVHIDRSMLEHVSRVAPMLQAKLGELLPGHRQPLTVLAPYDFRRLVFEHILEKPARKRESEPTQPPPPPGTPPPLLPEQKKKIGG